MLETPIHPSIPITLHPGIPAPARHAAAQMALHVAYRCVGAIADHRYRRGPRPDVKVALKAVNANLGELRSIEALLKATGADTSEVESSITRVEAARAALEEHL